MDTLPTSSWSRRPFTSRAVRFLPDWPASGEVLMPMVIEIDGSSTWISGSGFGSLGSARVSPMVISGMPAMMDVLQKELLERAKAMREKKTRIIDTIEEFEAFFKGEGGGFAWVHWAGTRDDEDAMAKRFETSIRCIPFEEQIPAAARGAGVCILTGKPSAQRVLMAKSY